MLDRSIGLLLMAAQTCCSSTSTKMSEKKEFDNAFKDFSTTDTLEYIDVKSGKIRPNFAEQLRASAVQLLTDLSDRLPQADPNDYSVYTGTSGIALLLQLAAHRQVGGLFNPKDLLQRALLLVENAIPRLKKKRFSFLNGDAGPLAIGAVLNNKLGHEEKAAELVKGFRNLLRSVTDPSSDIPNELLYGRVGYLYGQLYVNKHIGPDTIDGNDIRSVIASILNAGQNMARTEKSDLPLMYMWHSKNYVGAAHGTAGILYILLQAREFLDPDDLPKLIQPTLDGLLGMRFQSNNLPSSVGNASDRLVQWCHGAPGVTILFSLAYQVFGEERYKEAAIEFGEVVWQRGLLKKGCGLCHGTAGNGYSFVALYQLTKDVKYLYRSCTFADWCRDYRAHRERVPDRPLSLFEGLAGVIYFLVDLLEPTDASMPAYTV